MSGILGSVAPLAFPSFVEKPSGFTKLDVFISFLRSIFTGSGKRLAFGSMINIFPGVREMLSPNRPVPTRMEPSRTKNLILFPARCSSITVVPVIDAVIDAVRMVAPP